jgi:hypothetical protein
MAEPAAANSGYKGNLRRNLAMFGAIAAAMLPVETVKLPDVAGDSLAR